MNGLTTGHVRPSGGSHGSGELGISPHTAYPQGVSVDPEVAACIPHPIHPEGFNPAAVIPYGLSTEHILLGMQEFQDFLGFVNIQLNTKSIARFEVMLMPANFSSLVGEFMKSSLPKYCTNLAANTYHNGHPDLVPSGMYAGNAAQHVTEGIEIKGSRYFSGWQGHNAEDAWLLVYVFDANRGVDAVKGIGPRPFRFLKVVGAQLAKADWVFSGRSSTSRRTITASVTRAGSEKMENNWIYRDLDVQPELDALAEQERLELES